MSTRPPYGDQFHRQEPRGADNFFTGLRRIDMRRSTDSWIGGVCSGLAERLGVDALVIRALFAVLSLGMGLGVLVYLAAWLLIPDQEEDTHIEMALRDGRWESVILLVAAVLSLFGSFGWFGGGWWIDGGFLGWGMITLAIVALGAGWLWTEWSRREQPGFYSQQAADGQPTHTGSGAAGPTPPQAAGPPPPPPPHTSQGWESPVTAPVPSPAPDQPMAPHPSTSTPVDAGDGPTAPGPRHTPKPPPAPRRPGRRSAGAAGTLLGVGLALAVGGGLAWAAEEYQWAVDPMLLGLSGALGALGLVVLVLGLSGRTAGFPGALAVVAMLATATAVPIGHAFVPSAQIGDRLWEPAELSSTASPFRLGMGDGTLDLTGLEDGDVNEPIEASVSLGTLTIVVPEELTVHLDANTGMGSIERGRVETSGVNVREQLTIGQGPVEVDVRARVGLGQIVVEGGR